MLDLRSNQNKQVTPLNVAIRNRRATQGFKPDEVPEEILNEILESSLLAPSGYNLQPWRFIVVKDADSRKRLRAVAMNQPKVEEAPVVVIACADPNSWKTDIERVIKLGQEAGQIKDDKSADFIRTNANKYLSSIDTKVWATKQTMIAFTHMMLLSETFGLDTAPMEGFFEDQVKKEFQIPDDLIVLALLAIGYAGKPDRPFGGRFDLGDLISLDKFGMPYVAS
ncbi:MAG: nitroreductase family protein [Candidatus Obscuribacterales bacterium]|jgi:nitroreductase|nr:nitroreductase family protein [Candidatus Obscuribacterales bacterium]